MLTGRRISTPNVLVGSLPITGPIILHLKVNMLMEDLPQANQLTELSWLILYSSDLEATRDKVLAAGGTIVKDIFSFPGGRRFQFTDPDGYELAVWSE